MRPQTVQKLLNEAIETYPEIKTIGELKEKAREIQKEHYGTTSENSMFVHDVTTEDGISKAANHMAEFGNYPLGMSVCEVVGINGGCGINCLQHKRGDCDVFDYEQGKFK